MRYPALFALWLVGMFLLGCATEGETPASEDMDDAPLTWQTMQDSTNRVAAVDGFAGPEAVRYDPEQDVYFVSNFNGGGGDRDANGFISRLQPDGTIDSLRFMTGTEAHPMHAPRGMYIVGDTLWAADADGLHGFNRQTGAHLAFIDFTAFEPGFLNDIAQGPDEALYVTDSNRSRLYRAHGGEVTVAVDDSLLGPPNGITWDDTDSLFRFAPWGGTQTFRAWRPDTEMLEEVGTSPGGNFDGIEIVGDYVVVASQSDSSLHVFDNGLGRVLIHLPGRPADIGIDTQRNHVAVPYVALNRVDIWELPGQ